MLSAPLFHGDVGSADELMLLACSVLIAVTLFAFYFVELLKSKDNK